MEEYRKLTQEIHKDRIAIRDIIVTSILFGLTLNLISDFLTGLPETTANSLHFIYTLCLALGSLFFTVFLLKSIAVRELQSESKLRRSGGFLIEFDPSTGFPNIQNKHDIHERYALEFLKQNPMGSEYAKGILELDSSQESYNKDMTYLAPLGYYVFYRMLSDLTKDLTDVKRRSEINVSKIITKDTILTNLLKDCIFYIPGNCKVELLIDPDYPNSSFSIIIIWNKGFHGKIILEFNIEDVYNIPEVETTIICTLICSAEFSPFRLGLGVSNVDGLIAWAHFLLENLNISENLKGRRLLPRKIPWDFR
ncbi:MAG: hypothetical protein RTU30_00590 [Candidatus Thorarchaeota archaeon]